MRYPNQCRIHETTFLLYVTLTQQISRNSELPGACSFVHPVPHGTKLSLRTPVFQALGEIEWVKPLRRGRFPGQILGIM
jgi:hypothetical protein